MGESRAATQKEMMSSKERKGKALGSSLSPSSAKYGAFSAMALSAVAFSAVVFYAVVYSTVVYSVAPVHISVTFFLSLADDNSCVAHAHHMGAPGVARY